MSSVTRLPIYLSCWTCSISCRSKLIFSLP